jgi:hypothetical protein
MASRSSRLPSGRRSNHHWMLAVWFGLATLIIAGAGFYLWNGPEARPAVPAPGPSEVTAPAAAPSNQTVTVPRRKPNIRDLNGDNAAVDPGAVDRETKALPNPRPTEPINWAAIWTLALGGLGAVATVLQIAFAWRADRRAERDHVASKAT